ncbi:FG-GAP repeat domain-containing protein [Desulfatibacillum aliphaticivorans]|uniref:FG-GAP repeat domain-containing protein n=1 Tax=Desulfatibacillum aliphaticivorans TaxID=218208 RepID=UPI0004060E6E|nr:VCBS repeat-containing protein [Desulfatibacillum aliphaticivorans]
MQTGQKVNKTNPQKVAEALAQKGATVLFANKNLGCALAFTNTGRGVERKTHRFTTSHPITGKNALSRSACKELTAAGLLNPMGSESSAKRLIARGALAAAFSGAMLMSGGLNNAMAANDLGLKYYGGTNPLAKTLVYDAKPAFVDIDGDGDLDCFVGGGYGYIEFWKNNGTSESPNFSLIEGNANPLTGTEGLTYLASPAFVDIDGDGDMDCFVGHDQMLYQSFGVKNGGSSSYVSFFENTGSKTNPVFSMGNITDTRKTVGFNPLVFTQDDEASPTFADVDGDGDMDAFIGGEDGYIWSYENMTVDNSQTKTWLSDAIQFIARGPLYATSISKDQESFYIWAYGGCAVPFFTDIDGDGDLDLFVGNKYGAIQYFENTGDAQNMVLEWREMCQSVTRMAPGMYAAPAFADINGNGTYDLFVGASPLEYYIDDRKDEEGDDFPALSDLGSNIFLRYYQNVGSTTAPDLRSRGDNPFNLGPAALMPSVTFGDMDGDGDLDAIVGAGFNLYNKKAEVKYNPSYFAPKNMKYFENRGSATNPLFAQHSMYNNPWSVVWDEDWYMPAPTTADLNGDGVDEVYVGVSYDTYYNNVLKRTVTPTAEIEAFSYVTDTGQFDWLCENPLDDLEGIPIYPQAAFVDIDGDGDLDAFISGVSPEDGWDYYNADIMFYRNVGTAITPTYALVTDTNPLTGVPGVFMPYLSFSDWDGDGDSDAVLSDRFSFWSIIFYAMMQGTKEEVVTGTLEFDLGTRYFENTGTVTEAVFEEQTGDANPFSGFLDKTFPGATTIADLDADGDPDAVFGEIYGKFYYYRNVETVDEALAILKDDDDLCFVQTAGSESSSMWRKVKEFFAPSRY